MNNRNKEIYRERQENLSRKTTDEDRESKLAESFRSLSDFKSKEQLEYEEHSYKPVSEEKAEEARWYRNREQSKYD